MNWYVVGTVRDGDRIVDEGVPLAVLGPWTYSVAVGQCYTLRTRWSARDFDLKSEDEVEIDHERGRVRTTIA